MNPNAETDARDMFSMQLQRLAGLASRITALSIPPDFQITVIEWRVLAIIDYLGGATPLRLVSHSGMLKSQMSRTLAQLSERGLIHRQPNPDDKRSALLYLSEDGQTMVTHILAAAKERNARMLSDLSTEESAQLRNLMRRVYDSSLDYYRELKSVSPSDCSDEPV